jgi:hypothetical protein
MKKTKYQLTKERNRVRTEAYIESNTLFYVKFVKKDCGFPVQFFARVGGFSRDPEKHPATLERAFKMFESREKVADWREIADRYECGGELMA